MLIFKLAFRNILRNRKRTLLTVLLISFSLTALIFTDGYVVGMGQNMVKSATRLFPGDAQIHHPNFLLAFESKYHFDPGNQVQALQNEPEVDAATARVISPGMLSSSANVLSVQVYGINPITEARVSKLASAIVSGKYLSTQEQMADQGISPRKFATQIVLGHRLAENLEVELGDRLVLSVPQVEGGEVSQELFRVSGIFKFNTRSMDEVFVFIPIDRLQAMAGLSGQVHEIAVNLLDPKMASDASLSLWQKYTHAGQEFQGWAELLPQVHSMMEMMNYSLVIVGVILFVIASLGVINAMFMSIYERIWEFGVVKAIGTTPATIFNLILVEGLLIGLISVVVGAALGFGLNYWVSLEGLDYSDMEFSGVAIVEPVKTVLRSMQFTQLPLWVLFFTLVACLYPALFAARILPSRALHKSL